MMYRIMIVEDDTALGDMLSEGLLRWGFEPVMTGRFDKVVEEFVQNKPHLVLMDINLPYYDGFYWCGKIRELSRVPIIFLSSRDSNMDIVMAVNMGADDYLTKPFAMDILLAKMSALLRRVYAYSGIQGELVECGAVVLNVEEGFLYHNNDRIELTRNELKIMTLLMKNRGKIIMRERIMRILWDDDVFVNENTLTVNVNRLRGRLAEIGLEDFIITRRGQGYMVR